MEELTSRKVDETEKKEQKRSGRAFCRETTGERRRGMEFDVKLWNARQPRSRRDVFFGGVGCWLALVGWWRPMAEFDMGNSKCTCCGW